MVPALKFMRFCLIKSDDYIISIVVFLASESKCPSESLLPSLGEYAFLIISIAPTVRSVLILASLAYSFKTKL